MCVVCRTRRPQAELVRVARLPERGVVVGEKGGRGSGRGAYVCHRRACWSASGLPRRLGHALRATLDEADRLSLSAFGRQVNYEKEHIDGG